MTQIDGSTLHHPRITKAYANSLIVIEKYFVDHELSVVVCIVKLKNRHRLTADAIVANSDVFEQERGKNVARKKILEKIIEHEMYQLRTMLSNESKQGE